jgi:hypothetical protein
LDEVLLLRGSQPAGAGQDIIHHRLFFVSVLAKQDLKKSTGKPGGTEG